MSSIILLFFSRLLMGASAANISLCLSSLADLSRSQTEKERFYGYGSVLAGLTFILGPWVGGKLSDPLVHPAFHMAFPLWIGALFSLINLLFLFFAFAETMQAKKESHPSLTENFDSLKKVFVLPSIKKVYLVYFFYLLSWNMLFQLVPATLVTHFKASQSLIGDLCALMGLSWMIGSFILYKVLMRFFTSRSLLVVGAFLFSFFVAAAFFTRKLDVFSVVLGASVFFASFGWPLCAGQISAAAGPSLQGKLFGFSQSMQALAMILAPLLMAPFLSQTTSIAFLVIASFGLCFTFFSILLNKTK